MKPHPLATSLAVAVSERSPDGIGAHLVDDVRLRAILPGGPIEDHGRDAVLARYALWFGEYQTVELAEAFGDEVGDRVVVHYKLLFDLQTDPRVLSQTLVCTLWDGLVGRIDLVCSGYRELP